MKEYVKKAQDLVSAKKQMTFDVPDELQAEEKRKKTTSGKTKSTYRGCVDDHVFKYKYQVHPDGEKNLNCPICSGLLYNGDCFKILKKIKKESVNLIFSDPPYNLSGDTFQTCKSGKPTKCDKGEWDQIKDLHKFNKKWIKLCRDVLSKDGTIWISGTLHSHPSIGMALKEYNFWIINDLIWFKPNATPLLSGNRFAPSTELIWVASKSKKYYFDYETAKNFCGSNRKQMTNLWKLNATRHITNHPTEKPEKLLKRIILIGSKEGDTILDPFMGSGTTGVVAKRQNRNFIGIEIEKEYFETAKDRIKKTSTNSKIAKYFE